MVRKMNNKLVSVILAVIVCGSAPFYAVTAYAELSYSGSSTIGMGILEAGAVSDFELMIGIKFSSVEMLGSGKGIQALLEGKATVAGVSRALKTSEKNRGLVGTVIGYDAIAIFVHANNPVTNLTRKQLKGIFTGRIRNWKEVGGKDAPIEPNTEIAGAGRATMLAFQEMIMDNAPYGDGFKQIDFPRDQIIETAKNENAICAVSMGLLAKLSSYLRSKVKIVDVNGIPPTQQNISSGAYPISRPLLLVTKGKAQGDTKKFIDYMLTPKGQRMVQINFVSLKK